MARRWMVMAGAFILLLFLFAAVDWIVWRVRLARGTGTEEVTVSQVSAATLKRNREEYYFDGDITVTCARSLLPPLTAGGWMPPCWYMRRHRTVVTTI